MTKKSIPDSLYKTAGVYRITCTANGRAYVGSTVDIGFRFHSHRNTLKAGKHHNSHLMNAWQKYGEDAFRFEVLEVVEDAAKLVEREQWWIDRLGTVKNGFNLRPRASTNLGSKRSEESRANMSAAQRGRTCKPFTEEHRRNLSEANRGKVFSEEHRRKLSEAASKRRFGPLTEEHKQKISSTQKGREGRPHDEETRRKMSETRRGRKMSEEAKRKISEALRGKAKPPVSEGSRQKMRESRLRFLKKKLDEEI